MHPEAFRIGGYFQSTYGVMVTLAFLSGLWMSMRLGRKAGFHPDVLLNLGIYVALGALVGAKLMMVVTDLGFYLRHPLELFSLSTFRAGGIFFGGLISALVVAVLYLRHKRLPGWVVADTFAPGLALGHAIGRTGCFLAGCCWGQPTALPWAVTFTNPVAHEMFGTPLWVPVHPAQLYEALGVAGIFGLVYYRYHRPHHPGGLIGLYLALYGILRFGLEFVRAHDQSNPLLGPLVLEQWVALVLAAAGAWLVFAGAGPARRAKTP
jgi:phosphatidylglycerol:prolipoprotein diacylglycerol transferase